MNRAALHRLLASLLAVGTAGSSYWLVGDVVLATVTGLAWGLSVLLVFRIARLYPSHATGTSWADKRWTAVGASFVTLAALVGVSPTLPTSGELRLGLVLLLLGVAFVGYVTGTMAELERGDG